MKHAPYPKYKQSGVEWLGDVPEHWVTWKATHGFRKIGSGTTPKSDDAGYYDGDIPWVTTSELRESVILDTATKVTAVAVHDYPTLRLYPRGTLLFAMYGATIGRLGILGIAATVNQACAALAEPLHLDTWFTYYWLQMRRPTLIVLSAGGGQPNLSQDDLRQLRIPAPPPTEQHAIADFLDRETKKIDTLVAKKRTLIERLKEKRTALISRTVTRGLPPDAACAAGLDPYPKLKPSGIDWLGDVPKHWELKQLKWAVMFQRGHDLPADEREEGTVPLVSSSGVSATHSHAIAKGPGIVTGRYGTIGEFYLVEADYWPLNTTLYSIDLRGNEPRFLQALLTHLSPLFLLNAVKSAVPGVDRNDIHPIAAVVPPVSEQEAIADFLDRETKGIDGMVAKVETAIERLEEYRTALITAAVTGKIDVRGGGERRESATAITESARMEV